MHGWMDGWMDGWTDGWMDGWMYERMTECVDNMFKMQVDRDTWTLDILEIYRTISRAEYGSMQDLLIVPSTIDPCSANPGYIYI